MGKKMTLRIFIVVIGSLMVGLVPGCVLPVSALLPLGLRAAGNAIIDGLLVLSQ